MINNETKCVTKDNSANEAQKTISAIENIGRSCDKKQLEDLIKMVQDKIAAARKEKEEKQKLKVNVEEISHKELDTENDVSANFETTSTNDEQTKECFDQETFSTDPITNINESSIKESNTNTESFSESIQETDKETVVSISENWN